MSDTLGYVPHGLNLLLCLWVLLVAFQNFWHNRKTVNVKLKRTINAFGVFQVLTMVAYMYNQSVWLIENHDDAVGIVPSVTWLAYDYLNSIFHLTAASLVTHYIKGRCTC